MAPDSLPVVSFEDADSWDAWLGAHHAGSAGVWLKIVKKGSAGQGISYSDALDVALCHGWIDGQKGRLDDGYWIQRFTPRKRGSRWSKINTERVSALIAAGRMKPERPFAPAERCGPTPRAEPTTALPREGRGGNSACLKTGADDRD